MKIKRFRLVIGAHKKLWLAYALGVLGILVLLAFKLDSLVKGASVNEVAARADAISGLSLIYNPLFLPYKLIQYALISAHQDSLLTLRLVSTFFGLVIVGLFYYVLRSWHTRRIAAWGTALFGTSAWFLHTARSATPSVTMLGIVTLLAFALWLKANKKPSLVIFIGSCLFSALIYLPGFIWILLVGIIWQRKLLGEHFKRSSVLVLITSSLVFMIGLMPFVWGVTHNPTFMKLVVGLPADGLPSPGQFLVNFFDIFRQLLWRGPNDPANWLSGLPLLNIFIILTGIIGTYAYYFKRTLERTKFLAGSLAISGLLIALGGQVNIIILLPLIYLLSVAGITLLLQQWSTVFPRNPFAKTVASALLSVAVLIVCFYQISQYFIAWPNTESTRRAYTSRKLH